MGSIMDYDGHFFQVSAAFTPLQEVEAKPDESVAKPQATPANVNILKFMSKCLCLFRNAFVVFENGCVKRKCKFEKWNDDATSKCFPFIVFQCSFIH